MDAVNALPPYAVVKAVSDPAILVNAKQRWTSLGRDPRQLFTVYRHFDIEPANAGSWQSAVAHWRQMFARYVDKTYLEQYAPYVDFVLDANEYTARSTWTDPADKARVLQSMQAAATVWNDSYRGKEVHSADGGVGRIPDWCKFCLMCGPVNNPWPVEVFNIALDNDCPISYHAYTRYQNKQRYVNDWPEDSGLWDALERQYGMQPQWLFGESGPYLNSAEGWRSPNVLGGDDNALNAAMLAWWNDCAGTAAYADGRLIGAGAWFTSGGGASWQFYELQSQQLIRLAQTNAAMWTPGSDTMDTNKIRQHAKAIINIVDDVWWLRQPPVFKTAPPNKVLTFRHSDGTPIIPNPRPNPITYQLDVFQVNDMPELLRVTDFGGGKTEWWVLSSDVSAP